MYRGMNKLDTKTRAQILSMLVEGNSMRAISRMTGVSINTVTKLLIDAGQACIVHHSRTVQNVTSKRVQCDEIWSFNYAKQKNVGAAKAAPAWAGDVWTWTALDADSKLMISYMVGDRSAQAASEFMHDVSYRLANRVQLTSDGHAAYLIAVESAFGSDVDFAQLIKIYGNAPQGPQTRYSPAECIGAEPKPIMGSPDPAHISTSYVERSNLSIRMGNRRFTRLTNAFSKKIDNHVFMLALYFTHYNFCRIHKTLRVTPAMAAGIDTTVHDMDWVVGMIDAAAPKPNRPAQYKLAKGHDRHAQLVYYAGNGRRSQAARLGHVEHVAEAKCAFRGNDMRNDLNRRALALSALLVEEVPAGILYVLPSHFQPTIS